MFELASPTLLRTIQFIALAQLEVSTNQHDFSLSRKLA